MVDRTVYYQHRSNSYPSDSTTLTYQGMMPDYDEIKRAKGIRQLELHRSGVEKVSALVDFLWANHKVEFARPLKDWCFKHGCLCECCTVKKAAGSQRRPLCLVMAGSPCIAWTAEGAQLGVVHPSFLGFLVWIFDLRSVVNPSGGVPPRMAARLLLPLRSCAHQILSFRPDTTFVNLLFYKTDPPTGRCHEIWQLPPYRGHLTVCQV